MPRPPRGFLLLVPKDSVGIFDGVFGILDLPSPRRNCIPPPRCRTPLASNPIPPSFKAYIENGTDRGRTSNPDTCALRACFDDTYRRPASSTSASIPPPILLDALEPLTV